MIWTNATNSFTFTEFNGGELHLTVHGDILRNYIYTIFARINSPLDLIKLQLVLNWAKNNQQQVSLFLPYYPYARQDRFVKNEDFGSDMIADILNHYDIDVVTVDVHSEAAFNKVKRGHNVPKTLIFTQLFPHNIGYDSKSVLVAPDSGSLKSVESVAALKGNDVIICTKHRDMKTGVLSNIKAHVTNTNYGNIVVIDDICDGGGTFIPISAQIDSNNSVLYVTHGIFSKGFTLLLEQYNHIVTTNSFHTLEEYQKFPGYVADSITVLDIFQYPFTEFRR